MEVITLASHDLMYIVMQPEINHKTTKEEAGDLSYLGIGSRLIIVIIARTTIWSRVLSKGGITEGLDYSRNFCGLFSGLRFGVSVLNRLR